MARGYKIPDSSSPYKEILFIYEALDGMIVDLQSHYDEFTEEWTDDDDIYISACQLALDKAQTELKKLLRRARII